MVNLSNEPNAIKARLGEDIAKVILQREGFTNVKKREKGDKGFDLKAEKNGKPVTIEVKGTKSRNEIPDSYINEFDMIDAKSPKLRADFLLVVRIDEKGGNPSKFNVTGAHLLPRSVVNKYQHTVKRTIVLSRELKNYLKDAPEYWIEY